MVLRAGRTPTNSPPSLPQARAERILVVDDDPDTRDMCAEVLRSKGYDVIRAESGRSAETLLRTSAVDVTVTDLKMPDVGGLEILRMAKEVDPNMVVILITGFPAVDTAVEGMKFGAAEYLAKPFSPQQLLDVVQSSLEMRRTRESHGLLCSRLRRSFSLGGMVGQSRRVLALFDDIRRTAAVDAHVLILGESGTGKEPVARAIHANSRRRGRPFVPVNCSAIPENLLEAELFGYERGAFTGAAGPREGLLQAADGGTVFLDEVCEMSVLLQAKLLRVLEEGGVRRLGATKPAAFDVRFVAATNRDMREQLARQRFREDLFFRIAVIEVPVPPLRERREDIPLLAAHFLEASAAHYGKRIEGVSAAAMELLIRYDWPGNVRELKNAMERAVAYAAGPFVAPADLPPAVLDGGKREPPVSFHEWREKTLERLEREFLEATLEANGGNVTRAAQALGIHRSTLQRLMRRLNLPAA
jgi:two-component system response regulator HydG